MNEEQITKIVMEHTKEIAAVLGSAKSAHKRIAEIDKIAEGVHDLAKSVVEMATEIRLLTKQVDSSIKRIEEGQKAQGDRIGNIEKNMLARFEAIEKEPATKWKNFTWLIIAGVVTAVLGFLMAQLL